MPGLLQMFRDRARILRGLVVDTVVWCGICNPKRYPVNLDAIDPSPLPDAVVDPSHVPDLQDDTTIRARQAIAEIAGEELTSDDMASDTHYELPPPERRRDDADDPFPH